MEHLTVQNRLLGIIPVIVDQTQKVSSRIVVETSPSLVFSAEGRFRSRCALHEPTDDQYFEPAGIIGAAAVSSLTELNPLEFHGTKAKGMEFLTCCRASRRSVGGMSRIEGIHRNSSL